MRDVAARIVDAGLRRRRPAPKDAETLAPLIDDAFARLRFRVDGKGYAVVLDARSTDRVLHLMALSLGNILLAGELSWQTAV